MLRFHPIGRVPIPLLGPSLLVAVLGPLLWACSGSDTNEVRPSPVPRETFSDVSLTDWQGGVARLADWRRRERQNLQREPLIIPNDAGWQTEDGAPGEVVDGRVRFRRGAAPVVLCRDVDVSALDYNVLTIRMRVDAGSECTLTWGSEVEPVAARNAGLSLRVVPDDEFHSYTFRLDPFHAETWVGDVERLRFTPSDVAASVEIDRCAFGFDPEAGPARISVGHVTHEALFGSQSPWRLRPPEGAVFEVYAGMAQRSWNGPNAGHCRFVVSVHAADGDAHVVGEATLNPRRDVGDREWKRIAVDLSAYAGEEIAIRLDVDPLHRAAGDYAYWGNPMVYVPEPALAPPAAGGHEGPVPIVLISCDTTRADHFSCYGYHRTTTPHLDEWTKEAVLFENAIVEETWTLPSHVTMLTGLHPNQHGVTPNAILDEKVVTVPEALREAGYVTAGFTGAGLWFVPWRGIGHGFDHYDLPRGGFRPVFETHERVAAWLEDHLSSGVFLFVHNMDMHGRAEDRLPDLPYGPDDPSRLHFARAFDPPPRMSWPGGPPNAFRFLQAASRGDFTPSQEQKDYVIALYDDCIRMVDQSIHEFFQELKEWGFYDQALIIVTSDHGEDLGDHGRFGHWSVYEDCCRVPLIVKFPYGQYGGRRYKGIVQHVDLAPTMLDVAGVPLPERDGRLGTSLIDLLEGTAPAPRAHAYTQRYTYEGVRSPEWKLVRNRRGMTLELYDLLTDTGELHDVGSERLAAVPSLKEALEGFYFIDETGWHLVYRSPNDGKRRGFALSTDDRFETARLWLGERNNDRVTMHRETRLLQLDWPAGIHDVLLFQTITPNARVSLSIQSETDFVFISGGAAPKTVSAHHADATLTAALEPGERPYPRPDREVIQGSDLPTVAVWYVRPSPGGRPAKELSSEELEEVEALGYLGD